VYRSPTRQSEHDKAKDGYSPDGTRKPVGFAACGDSNGAVMATTKTDLKTLDCYRASNHKFRILDVPPMQYLMIDGYGDPNSAPAFSAAIATLYPVAYKLKFASKQELGRDYVVMPLEGLWWATDMATFTSARDKARWNWTLMIMVPEWTSREMFEDAVAKASKTDGGVDFRGVRLESLAEGRCVQTLHVGSFDDEDEILEEMHHDFVPRQGLRMIGKHHEIYFSDFRRVEPGRLRTILRQPVVAA